MNNSTFYLSIVQINSPSAEKIEGPVTKFLKIFYDDSDGFSNGPLRSPFNIIFPLLLILGICYVIFYATKHPEGKMMKILYIISIIAICISVLFIFILGYIWN